MEANLRAPIKGIWWLELTLRPFVVKWINCSPIILSISYYNPLLDCVVNELSDVRDIQFLHDL